MSATKPLGKTGNAKVIRQGHTESGSFGTNSSVQAKGDRAVRNLDPK